MSKRMFNHILSQVLYYQLKLKKFENGKIKKKVSLHIHLAIMLKQLHMLQSFWELMLKLLCQKMHQ